jgi:hypothetical protein
MIIDIYLIPFYIFKYVFPILFWIYCCSYLAQSDWYWELSEKLKKLYKKRKKNEKGS